MKRNKLSTRTVTHVAQEDNRPIAEKRQILVDYLYRAKHATVAISASNIYNMDETPVYIDMASNRTIAFQGEKSIEVVGTGAVTKITF